ncbi:MAG: molybdate ABC transporter permease subunit [Gemmatimonadetes bacterium]|nr:molybdate ABC transporter permease subunit [Gemmatimonadota bacterium]MDA1102127.1 molybdate ABC transporter permease subunit [Gemmatimonadota bacterium]
MPALGLGPLMLLMGLVLGPGASLTAQAPPASESRELLVLAASSLSDVLPAIASAWEGQGGRPVRFSFDATSRLAPQAVAGAQADVFVSADAQWVHWLEDRAATRGAARAVAKNELVVVVPRGSTGPSQAGDLERFGRVALAGENVPAGRYARAALASSGVWDNLRDRVISGGSVRSVLEWVARGEVPVGVVYRTDAVAEPAVTVAFAFDEDTHPPIDYWAVPLAASPDAEAARAFVNFMTGSEAARLFLAARFSLPAAPTLQTMSARAEVPEATLPSVGSAVRLSLLIAFAATLIGLVPAVGLGWLLARRDFRGKALVSTAVLAPLVMPPVVTGFLLLSVLGTQAPLGRVLSSLGLPVPFTILGATIAALIVGLPLYVLSARGAFEAVDPLYEELSWTLGVPPRQTFFRISLPLALPGVAAGAILAFARALGEFGATVVVAGNIEGSTRTIALAVYTLLESPSGRETTWVLVGASVALSLGALLGFEMLSRRQRRRMEDDRGR